MFKLLFLLSTLLAAGLAVPDAVPFNIVQTTGGQLQGRTQSTGLFSSMFSFEGIPYATPPVGNLRFRGPIPHPGWIGVRDATAHGENCIAPGVIGFSGSEDCLFLNVYTPILTGQSRPVMFFVHGGGFSAGSGDSFIYGADHLVGEDVVVVTVNYRLGVFGFLSTEDNHATGNYGLKDLVLALQWVRNNIGNFGGNPNDVTIFGQSAGACLVHFLVLSPSATGLFTKAIAQSGSALNLWAYHPNPLATALLVAREMGITATDTAAIANTLRFADVDDIMRAVPTSIAGDIPRGMYPTPFVPSRDPADVVPVEAFLPDEPLNLIRSGRFNQVPFISGYTDAECVVMLREVLINPWLFPSINNNRYLLVPYTWNLAPGSQAARAVADELYSFYFGDRVLTNELRMEWATFLTDAMFAHGIDTHVRLHSERQAPPVYYYKFGFEGDLSLLKGLLLLSEFPGAVHGDDLFYMFSITNIPPPLLPSNDAIQARRRMVRLWTNFARTGNPTVSLDSLITQQWTSVMGTQEFLDFNTTMSLGRWPFQQRMDLWNRLQRTYAPHLS
jgi:carboxylesterase type B